MKRMGPRYDGAYFKNKNYYYFLFFQPTFLRVIGARTSGGVGHEGIPVQRGGTCSIPSTSKTTVSQPGRAQGTILGELGVQDI